MKIMNGHHLTIIVVLFIYKYISIFQLLFHIFLISITSYIHAALCLKSFQICCFFLQKFYSTFREHQN